MSACKKSSTEPTVTNPVNNPSAVDAFAALNIPAAPFAYANQQLPPYLTAPNIIAQINTPADNAITDWGCNIRKGFIL